MATGSKNHGKPKIVPEVGSSRLKVVYIIGYVRSGSTILDTILGNHPQIESVGELANLHRSGWVNNEYCACGKVANECLFWNDVKAAWAELGGFREVRDYIALQARFERIRKWPRLLLERIKPTKSFEAYARQTELLFRAIQQVSKKPILVDSSKIPLRGLALGMIPGVDLHYVHLIRDGRGVAWSLAKSFRANRSAGIQHDLASKPIWRTALTWFIINIQDEVICRLSGKRKTVRIRYEDLTEKPDQVLTTIGQLMDLDLTPLKDKLINNETLDIGHTIAGNRLRMAKKIKLRLDTEWYEKMPSKDKRLFWLLCGSLMRCYGYKKS